MKKIHFYLPRVEKAQSDPESEDQDENNNSQPMQASTKQVVLDPTALRQQILPSFVACVVAALKMPTFIVVERYKRNES
jgi:hypothetical protein